MSSNKQLYELMVYTPASYPMFDPRVKTIMEQHLQYLKTAGNVRTSVIDNKYKGIYYGDFYAILNDIGLPAKYHYITLLLNGLTNPIDFVNQFDTVFIPDTSIIDKILMVYNTGKSDILAQPGQ